jgi:hypothetical protein
MQSCPTGVRGGPHSLHIARLTGSNAVDAQLRVHHSERAATIRSIQHRIDQPRVIKTYSADVLRDARALLCGQMATGEAKRTILWATWTLNLVRAAWWGVAGSMRTRAARARAPAPHRASCCASPRPNAAASPRSWWTRCTSSCCGRRLTTWQRRLATCTSKTAGKTWASPCLPCLCPTTYGGRRSPPARWGASWSSCSTPSAAWSSSGGLARGTGRCGGRRMGNESSRPAHHARTHGGPRPPTTTGAPSPRRPLALDTVLVSCFACPRAA